jgi:hypothetical protein
LCLPHWAEYVAQLCIKLDLIFASSSVASVYGLYVVISWSLVILFGSGFEVFDWYLGVYSSVFLNAKFFLFVLENFLQIWIKFNQKWYFVTSGIFRFLSKKIALFYLVLTYSSNWVKFFLIHHYSSNWIAKIVKQWTAI